MVLVLYHFVKSRLPLLHQFLPLDPRSGLFYSLLSDTAMPEREPSFFLNSAAAGWIVLKFQNAYCPVSC